MSRRSQSYGLMGPNGDPSSSPSSTTSADVSIAALHSPKGGHKAIQLSPELTQTLEHEKNPLI